MDTALTQTTSEGGSALAADLDHTQAPAFPPPSGVVSPPKLSAENFYTLPPQMRESPRWMLWCLEPHPDPAKKPGKVPYYTNGSKRSGELDTPADMANFATFDDALIALQTGRYTGLGFALGPDGSGNFWQGIDLDDLPNRPALGDIADNLPGYTEASPSGKGMHAIGYGRPFDALGSNGTGIEAYARGRYFTVTGSGAGINPPVCLADYVEQRLKPMHGSKAVSSAPPDGVWTPCEAVSPHTVMELRSALLHMRADDRDLWVRMGHALKTLGVTGRGLFLHWSATSEAHDPLADAKTWDSFKPTHTGYQAVFAEAQRLGWINPASNSSALGQSRRERQREDSRRIGEGEDFDPMPEIMDVAAMLDRRIFLSDGSRVFDVSYPAHTLAFADFKNATAASCTEVPSGTFGGDGKPKFKNTPNAVLWLRHAERRSAVSATFKAGDGLFVSDPNGRHCVNLWNGFNRVVDGSGGNPAVFLDHVQWLFKDRADDFLDWLAHIEQRPGELPHTAWLHISSHTGTGRNAMAAILANLFAGYAAMAVDLVHVLDSGFNERLSRKVIAVCDEIREGGAGQWKHAEALKQMITASARNINTKYGRQCLEHNACRFLMFSNHRSAIPLDDTDRRIEVVICDEVPLSPDYYSLLYTAVNDPVFIASIARFLRERDISDFSPGRHAMRSAAKEQVIATSRSPAISGLLEFNEGYPLELVVSGRLEYAADLSGYRGHGRQLMYAAQEAGWERLGRKRYNCRREILYVRREHFAKWSCGGDLFTRQLPKVDGGDVDWEPGSGDAEFHHLI